MSRTLFAAALLCGASPGLARQAAAAPLPPAGASAFERYLLDDTDFILILNAKQALASPLFQKSYAEIVRGALADPEAQKWLKGAGFDPLTDVERVVLFMGPSCFPDDPDEHRKGTGPLFLFQGKFDEAKLRAKLARLAKDSPDAVVLHTEGRGTVYELKGLFPFQSSFLVVGKDAAVLSLRLDRAKDALARFLGAAKAKLKHKEMADFLKKIDPDVAVQGIALGSSIWGTSVSSAFGEEKVTVRHTRLGDAGLTQVRGTLAVKDDIVGAVTLTARDAETAKRLTEQMRQGLAEATRELERMAERVPEVKPAVEAFKAVQLKPAGKDIALSFKGGNEALKGMFRLLFSAGAGAAPPPKPAPGAKDKAADKDK